ncbi:MAG TPA: DUF2911 domain-containing protein [Vicinamibacterales bacterium]|nr:DUF2911 domain-containing protein [Vicinamibacterales bacterium]
MHLLTTTLLCGALSAVSLAQSVPAVKLPSSPPGQAAVQLGGRWDKTAEGQRYRDGKWLVVNYSRPLLRGRTDIFGAGADYGKFVNGDATIWRVGANDTTRLTTEARLQIGGTIVAPGVYNVFVDLKPGAWTFVLNTQPVQEKYDPNEKVKLFGAYNYDAKFDVLRTPMTVRQTDVSTEQLTIGFVNVSPTNATLEVRWDRTVATLPLALAAH